RRQQIGEPRADVEALVFGDQVLLVELREIGEEPPVEPRAERRLHRRIAFAHERNHPEQLASRERIRAPRAPAAAPRTAEEERPSRAERAPEEPPPRGVAHRRARIPRPSWMSRKRSRETESAVYVVNVDASSDGCGQRIPVEVASRPEPKT